MSHEIRKRITANEWRRVTALALVVMALTTVPYIVGAMSQRDGWQFSGFAFGLEDGNNYLAKMREGARGDWLFTLAYTSERQTGVWLFVPYLWGGKIAGLLAGGSDAAHNAALITAMLLVFHGARIVCGVLAIVAIYWFAALFLPRGGLRWLAVIVISVGSGLGWLLIALDQGQWLGSLPIDFYIPEAYTFMALYGLPHIALGLATLLAGFTILATRKSASAILLVGACWLITSLCVTFYIGALYIVLAVWGVIIWWRGHHFPMELAVRTGLAALVPAPVFIYGLFLTATNPALAVFNAQSHVPSPHPLQYAVGYMVVAIPAIFGVRWAWRRGKRQPIYLLLLAWVVTAPFLAYTPVSVQRRLIEGAFTPLCILAVAGLRFVIVPALTQRRFFRRRRIKSRRLWRYAAALTLALTLPTAAEQFIGGIAVLLTAARPLFYPPAEMAAFDWLNTHAPSQTIVLTDLDTGNALSARTDLRAFLGHGVETLYSEQKRALVADFFNGTKSLADIQTPDEIPIRYVIYSPEEAVQSPPDSRAQWSKALTLIYNQDGYEIYQVP
ncbi:MAG: hypothetical protein ACYDBJ_00880 [Aggregatilineales bacterium]